jgi:tetratricopeptide (TPR) repeat protein
MNIILKNNRLAQFIKCSILCFWMIPVAHSQDFKINDKKPLPIPIPGSNNKPVVPQKVDTEAAFIEGMKYFLMEEYSKAIDIFEKTLKDEPNNAGLAFQMASTYQKLKKTDKAIEYAQKAYDLNEQNMLYGQMLAALLAKNENFEKAAIIYKKLFDKDPNNSEIGLDLAAAYYNLEKFDDVLKIYQRIENNLGASRELTNQKQRIYLKQNKIKNAIEEGEKLIKSDPQEIDNYIDLAELLIRNNKDEQAIGYINQGQKINPSSGQLHILLADLARRKNDFGKMFDELNLACDDKNIESGPLTKILYDFLQYLPEKTETAQKEKLINKIIVNNPNEPRGFLLLAEVQLQNDKKIEARDNYLKAVSFDKNNSQIWMRILAIDNELSAFKEAITHSEEAIELYPNQAIFWYYNGTSYFMLKQYEKANESLEEARRLAGKEKELLLIVNSMLGESYNRLKLHSKSDEAYELVLKTDPNNDAVANNYSYFLALRNEKIPYALEIASKLIERNPNNSTFLDTYGWILFINKEYEKSKQYLEKAYLTNEGKSNVITEHYGDVLFKLGDKDKAIEIWKLAAAKDPNNKILLQKITEGRIVE